MRGTASGFPKQLDDIRRNHRILGFYIQFESKTMRIARAYFPSLCSRTRTTSYEHMCPMRSLVEVSSNCMVRKSFMKKINKGKKFSEYLKRVSEQFELFALYSLRIGGRTWMISEGMDRQFCDFLGTWKSPEASARYYRGDPAAVLKLLRKFYLNLKQPDNLTEAHQN